MKLILILCLASMAADARAVTAKRPQPVQAFTAVFWTTTTLHTPAGKPSTFMRRSVYTRDAAGIVRCEIYRPTKGLLHDTAAPLERVVTGSSSPQVLPHIQSGQQTVEQTDLGTLQFSGVAAKGTRRIFRDSNGQPLRTVETWFSPTLGLTVHMESTNARGDTAFRDLSELRFGNPVVSSETVPAVTPAIPLLTLYRGLFMLIAHMERDRLANDPNRHVNMGQIEEHLRNKIGLSNIEWRTLVDESVKVESYTHDALKQAHDLAEQNRPAFQQNPASANTLATRATLHNMRLDINTHVQGEIDKLNTALGSEAATRIQAYLHGPLAASTSRAQLSPAHIKALRAHRGEGQ